jgi:hypothetical protein
MTTSRCSSWPSTQLPRKQPLQQPLQQPPGQPLTIAYLLCCGAAHLYVNCFSTATELKEFSQRQD